MKNIVYSIVGVTIIALSIASTFLLPDSEYENLCVSGGEVSMHASLNPNFTAKFKDCNFPSPLNVSRCIILSFVSSKLRDVR